MSNSYKYPYYWAEGIVTTFMEKYTRGCTFVALMAGISSTHLKKYCIHCIRLDNQVRWETIKLLVKRSNYKNFKDFEGLDVDMRQKYLTYEKYSCEDSVIEDIHAQNAY